MDVLISMKLAETCASRQLPAAQGEQPKMESQRRDEQLTQSSDEDLIQRIGAGDESAFAELYRRLSPEVFRFAYAMCGAKSMAEDCTQEVFLSVLRKSAGYRGSLGSVRAWLFGTARHKAIDRFRQQGRIDHGLDIANVADSAQTVEREIEEDQRSVVVRQAIVTLPARYREVVVLCELEEQSYAEAAITIGCPVGTVRSRLHRAREMLATRLRSRVNVVGAKTCGAVNYGANS